MSTSIHRGGRVGPVVGTPAARGGMPRSDASVQRAAALAGQQSVTRDHLSRADADDEDKPKEGPDDEQKLAADDEDSDEDKETKSKVSKGDDDSDPDDEETKSKVKKDAGDAGDFEPMSGDLDGDDANADEGAPADNDTGDPDTPSDAGSKKTPSDDAGTFWN